MKDNCFETQLRRVYKELLVQKTVINIECLHQAINISASKKAPFHFKEMNEIFVPFTIRRKLIIWQRSADTCIPSQVTILRIKPHFMYHDN